MVLFKSPESKLGKNGGDTIFVCASCGFQRGDRVSPPGWKAESSGILLSTTYRDKLVCKKEALTAGIAFQHNTSSNPEHNTNNRRVRLLASENKKVHVLVTE